MSDLSTNLDGDPHASQIQTDVRAQCQDAARQAEYT